MNEKIIINPISEYFSSILGAIGILLLIRSINTFVNSSGSGFGDIAALFFIIFHLIIIIIALPFMIRGLTRKINNWFRNIILLEASINAILMMIIAFSTPNKNSTSIIVFSIIALLELFPFLVYQKNKSIK